MSSEQIALDRKRLLNRNAQRRRRLNLKAKGVDEKYNVARRSDPETRKRLAQNAWNERRSDWGKVVLRQLRFRAKKRGIECSVTPADLIIPSVCPVLGIPLVISDCKSNFLQTPNSPSVDRLDNRSGYVPGNIRVISLRANVLKRDASVREIEMLLEWMKKEGAP